MSPRQSREFIRSWLASLHVDDPEFRADVSIVVAELVTNAVEYGRDPIEVHLWSRPQGVRIGVSDGEPTLPEQVTRAPDDDRGRGLRLVSKVSSDWGVEPRSDGKLVWADIAGPVLA